MMKMRWSFFLLVINLVLWAPHAWAQDEPPLEPIPEAGTEPVDSNLEVISPSEEEELINEEGAMVEPIAPETMVSPENVPEIYEIQTGDTLWDICQKFLDNPWYWPKLWSLNQYIENPHLIYPGNKVAFWSGSQTTTPRMDIVEDQAPVLEPTVEPKTETRTSMAPVKPAKNKNAVKLKTTKFVAEKDLNIVGEISHSGNQKTNLIFGDHVFLDFKKGTKVSVGDKFHVIDEIKRVKDPDSFFGRSLGTLVHRKAVLKIVALHEKTVEAVVVDNESAVSRGDELVPYQSTIHTVLPHEVNKDMKGEIVDSENQEYLIGQNVFVYLNLGKKDGVEDGQKLMIVRRGDGVFAGDDRHLPDVVIGRLLVVESGDRTSTAYVLDVKDSVSVGDRVRSKL